jgi:hypothetical protein
MKSRRNINGGRDFEDVRLEPGRQRSRYIDNIRADSISRYNSNIRDASSS